MESVKVSLSTWDIGLDAVTYEAWEFALVKHVLSLWEQGADIVVLPEYMWLGYERFVNEGEPLKEVARVFWTETWPRLRRAFQGHDKMVVLGTCPYQHEDILLNRAPIWVGGEPSKALCQDKIHLTPWEEALKGGSKLQIVEFKGLRCAVVICLDIEIPELTLLLKKQKVDLILVPSATENELGVERIQRCASARSVELGCYVGVAHLVGKTASALVDENFGCTAWYAPSQSAFKDHARMNQSESFSHGVHTQTFTIESARLLKMRKMRMETNPSSVLSTAENLVVTNSWVLNNSVA